MHSGERKEKEGLRPTVEARKLCIFPQQTGVSRPGIRLYSRTGESLTCFVPGREFGGERSEVVTSPRGKKSRVTQGQPSSSLWAPGESHDCASGLVVPFEDTTEESSSSRGFPGGAVVENPPANAGDAGSSPGLGRSHMPRSN